MAKHITVRQQRLLLEALRRYTRFHRDERLTSAWTGLGTRRDYAPAVNAGLMEWVHDEGRRWPLWLRLTEKGAKIVQGWIDAGLSHVNVERGDDIPRAEVP